MRRCLRSQSGAIGCSIIIDCPDTSPDSSHWSASLRTRQHSVNYTLAGSSFSPSSQRGPRSERSSAMADMDTAINQLNGSTFSGRVLNDRIPVHNTSNKWHYAPIRTVPKQPHQHSQQLFLKKNVRRPSNEQNSSNKTMEAGKLKVRNTQTTNRNDRRLVRARRLQSVS